jgi:hypothetical protein
MLTFPSVEAMMIVLPEEDGPNSFERSTLTVRIVPSTLISTFFMVPPPWPRFLGLEYNVFSVMRQGHIPAASSGPFAISACEIAQYMDHFLLNTGMLPLGSVWVTMGTTAGEELILNVRTVVKFKGSKVGFGFSSS